MTPAYERDLAEGKIDEQKTMADYVPEFVGTVWAPIKVIDVMDMSTGLDPIAAPEHFVNPDAVITRMVMAELGETCKTTAISGWRTTAAVSP